VLSLVSLLTLSVLEPEDGLRRQRSGHAHAMSPTVTANLVERGLAVKVTNLVQQPNGWTRFHLSVGGFVVKNCRWRPISGRIAFPLRYDTHGQRHKVIFAYGATVKRLCNLLQSGETQTPRDRRPCDLKIQRFGQSYEEHRWLIFNFTVRGFTIQGCRWQPQSGSIQLPVTFYRDAQLHRWRKKAVVCAWGSHIMRLRRSVEAHAGWNAQAEEQPVAEVEVEA
jgi:hypothetical protein